MISPLHGAYPITQHFGDNTGSYSSQCRPDGSHNGVDYGCPSGTPVRAAHAGVIALAGLDNTGYGIHVRISIPHTDKGTLYAHLESLNCAVGDGVEQGDVIGHSGSTGNSTGPHLHFEYRTDMSRCKSCVDPLPLITPEVIIDEPNTGQVMRVTAPGLNFRAAASISGKRLMTLQNGDVVTVTGPPVVEGSRQWLPVTLAGWVCYSQDGNTYLD